MRLAADLVRKHGISEATLYNWKEQRGMDVSEGQHDWWYGKSGS